MTDNAKTEEMLTYTFAPQAVFKANLTTTLLSEKQTIETHASRQSEYSWSTYISVGDSNAFKDICRG